MLLRGDERGWPDGPEQPIWVERFSQSIRVTCAAYKQEGRHHRLGADQRAARRYQH
jgi:hypothetical protein